MFVNTTQSTCHYLTLSCCILWAFVSVDAMSTCRPILDAWNMTAVSMFHMYSRVHDHNGPTHGSLQPLSAHEKLRLRMKTLAVRPVNNKAIRIWDFQLTQQTGNSI